MPPAEKKLSFHREGSLSGELWRGLILILGTSLTGKEDLYIANFSCTPRSRRQKVQTRLGGTYPAIPRPEFRVRGALGYKFNGGPLTYRRRQIFSNFSAAGLILLDILLHKAKFWCFLNFCTVEGKFFNTILQFWLVIDVGAPLK